MNINFENLEKISEIHKILLTMLEQKTDSIDKRWLTTEDLSNYIGYSKDAIKKMIADNELRLNEHYYKKTKKNLFDKEAIDKWIMFGQIHNADTSYIANNILSDLNIQ